MDYYPTPQHALPVFRDEPRYGETFQNADDYCARTFSLPMHPIRRKGSSRPSLTRCWRRCNGKGILCA